MNVRNVATILGLALLGSTNPAQAPESPLKHFELEGWFRGEPPPIPLLPGDDNGSFVFALSRGRDTPFADHWLVVKRSSTHQEILCPGVLHLSWRSPDSIIVERTVGDRDKGWSSQVIEMRAEGGEPTVLWEAAEGLTLPEVSPKGNLALIEEGRGQWFLTVRRCAPGLPEIGSYGRNRAISWMTKPVWSPDGNSVALSVWESRNPGEIEECVGLLDLEGDAVRLLNRPEHELVDAKPLFWAGDRVYASSRVGFVALDPSSSSPPRKVKQAYDPGPARSVADGVPVGDFYALLMVQDHKDDPLEARSKELHWVDLRTGRAVAIGVLPKDVFLESMDWISDSDQILSSPTDTQDKSPPKEGVR